MLTQYTSAQSGFRTKGPAIGLFAAQEIKMINGPLFVDHPYKLEREIIALSESRRTESNWIMTRVIDAQTDTLCAEVILNSATLKDSYANYEADAKALGKVSTAEANFVRHQHYHVTPSKKYGPKNTFITTDQMRYDALGCNGGTVARTPAIDGLAANGINYRRAHNQNVICMPARATIMTGQHVASHGVWMNGVSLPEDTPTVAHHLQQHNYRTAILGKAHFEPWLGSGEDFYENRMAALGERGPHRGFEHMELANHFGMGHSHYDLWLAEHHPDIDAKRYQAVTDKGQQNMAANGDTGAVQVWPRTYPRICITRIGSPSAPWRGWIACPMTRTGLCG